jgi:hypothetical protein
LIVPFSKARKLGLGMTYLLSCWAQTYFEKDLILEHAQQLARKQHAEKEGKAACKRKSHVARRQTSLTILGLGFLIRIVTTISL